ncbi:hypothetical protein CW707_04430 [Candidatus Bathyarchaeota archaeon]|nr:MAG: hypothetical protein CW667_04700 [Candidatus Bathyarchaeota archaeon]RJS81017.1 MAG: hypothetical protein CW707_04430 [Candidatus Bathyarchaeota archaeon]
MKNQNKGQIRIIEAFLAVLIIFSAFAVSANLTVSQKETRHNELAALGLQTLMKLDSDGNLSCLIDSGDWFSLREALKLALPSGVVFNLTVYNEQMQQVNTEVISNGAFSSQDIAFIEYLCTSENPVFRCYILHLYLGVAS